MLAALAVAGAAFVAADAAAAVGGECKRKAAAAVTGKFRNFYEGRRRIRVVDTIECVRRTNRKRRRYTNCDVYASTGDGAGDVTYKVMLNAACTRTLAAFVVDME
jgi:hypothetical protein